MYYKLSERLAETMLTMAKESPNKTLVKTEPSYNEPSGSGQSSNIPPAPGEQINVPGFEVFGAIAAIATCSYFVYRKR